MYSKLFKVLVTGMATIGIATAASSGYDSEGSNNVVMYWGQASAGSEKSLGEYCDKDAGDVFVISFLSSFGKGKTTLSVSGCDGKDCSDIGKDIKQCQDKGKKVLLSMGGAAGSYGFESDDDGEKFADTLWDSYGGGNGQNRPFGDAAVDGFDLDVENNNQKGYTAMVKKLRKHYDGADKDYYISAAPQCVYPDQNVGDVLDQSQVDMAFIQFYNNPCAVGKQGFNWDTWANFAKNKSPNKNIKLFLGLPGSKSAAGSGYVDPDQVKKAVQKIGDNKNFGGIMLWDASQAYQNEVDGKSYADQMKSIVGGSSNQSGNSSPSGSGSATSSALSSSGGASSGQGQQSVETSGAAQSTQFASVTSIVSRVTSTAAPSTMKASSTSAAASSGSSAPGLANGNTGSKAVVSSNDPSDCSGKSGKDLRDCVNKVGDGSKAPSSGESCDNEGEMACKDGKFAMCNFKKWVVFDCPSGTKCSSSTSNGKAVVGCMSQDKSKRGNAGDRHWVMGKIHAPVDRSGRRRRHHVHAN